MGGCDFRFYLTNDSWFFLSWMSDDVLSVNLISLTSFERSVFLAERTVAFKRLCFLCFFPYRERMSHADQEVLLSSLTRVWCLFIVCLWVTLRDIRQVLCYSGDCAADTSLFISSQYIRLMFQSKLIYSPLRWRMISCGGLVSIHVRILRSKYSSSSVKSDPLYHPFWLALCSTGQEQTWRLCHFRRWSLSISTLGVSGRNLPKIITIGAGFSRFSRQDSTILNCIWKFLLFHVWWVISESNCKVRISVWITVGCYEQVLNIQTTTHTSPLLSLLSRLECRIYTSLFMKSFILVSSFFLFLSFYDRFWAGLASVTLYTLFQVNFKTYKTFPYFVRSQIHTLKYFVPHGES